MIAILEQLANWAWQTTLYASVLIVLVLLLQTLGGRLLSPRWRYALSLLVLARLILPTVPESSVSLFNLAPTEPAKEAVLAEPSAEVALRSAFTRNIAEQGQHQPGFEFGTAGSGASVKPRLIEPIAAKADPSSSFAGALLIDFLPWVWLLGAIAVLGTALRQQWNLERWLRRSARPAESDLLRMLDSCRRELGIRRRVELLELPGLGTAALCGIWKPKVLVPAGLADQLDGGELRLVFLHELAHLKKGDLIVNWLVVAARALHWFNPLAWVATERLLADREIARDDDVIRRSASADYGQTLVKLLNLFRTNRLAPGAAPILTTKHELKRRLTMLSKKHLTGRLAQLICALIIAALGAVTFTTAVADDDDEPKRERARKSSAERERDGDRERESKRKREDEEEDDDDEDEDEDEDEDDDEDEDKDEDDDEEEKRENRRGGRERERGEERSERGEERSERGEERGARGERDETARHAEELEEAIRAARKAGQEEKAANLLRELKSLMAKRRGAEVEEKRREGSRERGDEFEQHVRQMKERIHALAEAGKRGEAERLEVQLERQIAERSQRRERPEPGPRERAEGGRDRAESGREREPDVARRGREPQGRPELERHVDQLTRQLEEMRRAMEEMQQEIKRLRGGGESKRER